MLFSDKNEDALVSPTMQWIINWTVGGVEWHTPQNDLVTELEDCLYISQDEVDEQEPQVNFID